MRDFRFVIPIKLEDLCQSSGESDVYCVQIEYNSRELVHKLNDCSDNLRSNGPKYIVEDFDVFYSCLKNFSSMEQKHRDLSWKIIFRSLTKLEAELTSVLSDAHSSIVECRNDYCNQLKMTVYVFCSLSELLEEQDIKQASNIDIENVGKKGKKVSKRTEESYDWQQNKEKGISLLYQLFSLPIHRLFSPAVVDDEFVNVITKCCYKMLENPSRNKESALTMNLFHLIGSSIEKHRQSLSFCLKLIQLLQHKEQLVSTLAYLVETIVKKHNQRIIICEIIREIKRIDIRELSRDSSGPRAISNFLDELSERCSAEFIPSISDLLEFLEEDSYLMRNATLKIIGHLVIKELSKESAKERNMRDQLLDKLEDHILDNNSYTRSCALKVWCMLCEAEVIPLPRHETLIEAVVGRLRDKSCFVRRYAVQFLNKFLAINPFIAHLPISLLKCSYKKEEEKLKTMLSLAKNLDQEMHSQHISTNELGLDEWLAIEPHFIEFWQEIESTTSTSYDDSEERVENETLASECNDVQEMFDRFRQLLTNKKFKSALSLLKVIKDQWPDNEIFNDHENSDEDEDRPDDITLIDEECQSPPLPTSIALAKKIFLAGVPNKDTILFDLGSKSVERDIKKVATGLISDSQRSEASGGLRTTTVEVARLSASEDSIVNDISKQQILVKYLGDYVKFTEQIQIALPVVCELLMSKNLTDVQEAIDFFVSAYKFGVQDSLIGVRKLILLIWSQEKSIKEAAVSAYRTIYLDRDSDEQSESNSKARAISVVKSLSELVMGATLGELISIEQLLNEFMNCKLIEKIHKQVMWEKFSMKLSNTTPEESRTAIQLIGMLATTEPDLIRNNLNTIITVGLGERGRDDSQLVIESCIALKKAYRLPKAENCELFFRLDKTHALFTNLSELLVNGLTNLEDKYWIQMCNEAIKVIFHLAENPDYICEQIIRNVAQVMITQTQCDLNSGDSNDNEKSCDKENITETQDTGTQSSQRTEALSDINPRLINSEILSRFISLIGDVALNMLIHLDLNILTELKIRSIIKEEKDQQKAGKTPRRRSNKTPGRVSMGGDQNLEEEIGLAGANAVEDQEQEYLTEILNSEILLGNNMLAKLSEIIVKVASDPISYPDLKLRAAACLSLAKCMALSEKFCRVHIRLLVTLMEKAAEPIIRANTVIALGDLCVRFPNLLDQWSSHMFQLLRDEDVNVKMNTLKVLSRLILSDMVKVKGQISEIAVLIVDQNELLSSSSRLFFTELGKKQNAIYNVMPDIISHLSDTEKGLEEDNFRIVMKYIFDLIEKDRQTVCLVEKLCQRFRGTTDERQWRDLAYCLSLLNYSDRSIQKLNENLICFADKLCISDFVHECIVAVIANVRKVPNIRNETKQIIDEFEHKINECRNKGVNEDDSEFQKVVGTPQSASRRQSRLPSANKRVSQSTNKKNKQTKPKRKERRKLSSDSESDDEVVVHKKLATECTSERRSKRQVKRLQPIITSDEEEED